MEDLTASFKELSKEAIGFEEIGNSKYYFPFIKQEKEEDYYRIYKTNLNLKAYSLNAADSTHVWWLYPINYDRSISEIFDDYTTYTLPDQLINKLARFIQYASIILALLSALYLFWIFLLEED
jgi:hypothetical protein